MLLSVVAETQVSAFAQWLDTACRSFDLTVFNFFGNLHADWFSPIVRAFTHLGDSEFVIPMMILGLILCFFKKTKKVGATLFCAILIGTLITNVALKPLIFRPRPYVSLSGNDLYMLWYNEVGALTESDRSFPSGHTTAAFEMAAALFLTIKNKKVKWIFPVFAVLIACSRLYLMVHYCTDVLGGMICGLVAGVLAFFLVKAILAWMERSENKGIQKIYNIDLLSLKKKETK